MKIAHKNLDKSIEESPLVSSVVEDLKQMVIDYSSPGIDCPVCGRYVKLYRRKLHNEMATFLIQLVRQYNNKKRWYSTRELVTSARKASTDGSYLVHWGLIDRKPENNSSGGTCGLYRPTEKGIQFARNSITVPSHLHMLCGEVVGFSETQARIEDCLDSPFKMVELMGGVMGGANDRR